MRSNQWIPSGKIRLLNTIMYSIYRLKGYKSEAVASRRLCFCLLGDCGEAGAYAFSGCVIAVLRFWAGLCLWETTSPMQSTLRDQHIIRIVLGVLFRRRFVMSNEFRPIWMCVGGLCCSVKNKPKWILSNGQFVISLMNMNLHKNGPC